MDARASAGSVVITAAEERRAPLAGYRTIRGRPLGGLAARAIGLWTGSGRLSQASRTVWAVIDERPDTPAGAPPAARVIGTEAATPLRFSAHICDGQYLELDELVTVSREVPGSAAHPGGRVDLYGMVTDLRAFHEGVEHHSDVDRTVAGHMYGRESEVASVMVTRIVPELFVPPLPGADVSRATGAARDQALYLDTMQPERRLPAGLHRAGGPVFIDADFLDGTNGAHVNISGVSGVATKTSYATFLLHTLFHEGATVLGRSQKHARALIFNVKGQDLLYLDQPNARLTPEAREQWRELNLPAEPFRSVALWSPPRKGGGAPQPAAARKDKVRAYWWSLADFCREQLLLLLFADADDERQQYTAVARNVAARLADSDVDALPQGGIRIEGQEAHSFLDLVRLLRAVAADEDERWFGRFATGGSIGAFMRRLDSAVDHVGHLVRGGESGWQRHRIRVIDGDEQVNVVDLTSLSGRAQRFVVGALLQQEFAAKEARGTRDPLLFVVLDELNKYAPRRGDSPIKATLVEIAERGRSLGMILVGAQQTASAVDEAIVTNASIKVVGRLDPAEAGKSEYRWMPDTQRDRAILLSPGTMVLHQPRVPVPMVITFPLPAWATRLEEVAFEVDDEATDALIRGQFHR